MWSKDFESCHTKNKFLRLKYKCNFHKVFWHFWLCASPFCTFFLEMCYIPKTWMFIQMQKLLKIQKNQINFQQLCRGQKKAWLGFNFSTFLAWYSLNWRPLSISLIIFSLSWWDLSRRSLLFLANFSGSLLSGSFLDLMGQWPLVKGFSYCATRNSQALGFTKKIYKISEWLTHVFVKYSNLLNFNT